MINDTNAMEFILIPADVNTPVKVVNGTIEEGWARLKKEIGFIEIINIPDNYAIAPGHQLYVDEEGRINGKPVNKRATSFMRLANPLYGTVALLAKPVLVGTNEETGDDEYAYPPLSFNVAKPVSELNGK